MPEMTPIVEVNGTWWYIQASYSGTPVREYKDGVLIATWDLLGATKEDAIALCHLKAEERRKATINKEPPTTPAADRFLDWAQTFFSNPNYPERASSDLERLAALLRNAYYLGERTAEKTEEEPSRTVQTDRANDS
jgi:hypothetical protein